MIQPVLGVIFCMLNLINIETFRVALSRFRVSAHRLSAHRLEVEIGRWHKPVAVPFNERK